MTRSIVALCLPLFAAACVAAPPEAPDLSEPTAQVQSGTSPAGLSCAGLATGESCPTCKYDFPSDNVTPCCMPTGIAKPWHHSACGCTHPTLGPKVCVEQWTWPWNREPGCVGGEGGIPLVCGYSVCEDAGRYPCHGVDCSNAVACCASPSTCPPPVY
jgi:hypothetical protein